MKDLTCHISINFNHTFTILVSNKRVRCGQHIYDILVYPRHLHICINYVNDKKLDFLNEPFCLLQLIIFIVQPPQGRTKHNHMFLKHWCVPHVKNVVVKNITCFHTYLLLHPCFHDTR